MKILTFALAAAAVACVPSTAAAWGQQGHMMVAAVAWELMSDTARCNAGKLLATMNDSRDYPSWTSGVAPQYRARTAFLRASNWPDNIRGRYDDADGYDPVEPRASQNTGYGVDKLVHAYWHFRNEPFVTGRELTEAEKTQFAPIKPNALSRIEDFSVALGESQDTRVRAYDLAWLIHLVGDVHQPLHAIARLTPNSQGALRGDKGGNLVSVCVDRACTSQTLHSFWDKVVGGSGDTRQATRQAIPLYARARAAPPEPTPSVWLDESVTAAKERAYTSAIGVRKRTYRLSAAYRRDALDVAHERIALGGARLAALLNQRLNQPCSDA